MEFSNVKFMNQDELLKSVEIEEGKKIYNNSLLKLCVLLRVQEKYLTT